MGSCSSGGGGGGGNPIQPKSYVENTSKGGTHHTVANPRTNVRMSWDTDASGNKTGAHITDQSSKSGQSMGSWVRRLFSSKYR